MTDLHLIFILSIIQASYDYLGWNSWLGEPTYYDWRGYLFRIVKWLLDFPVTIYVLYMLGFSWEFMAVFYFWKWCGGNDAIYFVFQIIRGKKMSKEMDWMNWTILGLYRWIKFAIQNKYFIRLQMSVHDYWAQIGIAYVVCLLLSILWL